MSTVIQDTNLSRHYLLGETGIDIIQFRTLNVILETDFLYLNLQITL
jgi:hypothetical protein